MHNNLELWQRRWSLPDMTYGHDIDNSCTQSNTKAIHMVTAGQTLPMLYISSQYVIPLSALHAVVKLMIPG